MKIHLSVPDSPYFVRRYVEIGGRPQLTLNDEDYSHSLIIHGKNLIPIKDVQSIEDLSPDLLEKLSERTPQMLLLGTGKHQIFLSPSLLLKLQPFIQKQIGIETMNTASAARTYNLLAQEGRDVMVIFIL